MPTKTPTLAPRHTRPGAGLIIRHTDRKGGDWWLLGQRVLRHGGGWGNIGGSLDAGEDYLTAAVREFTEEVGLPAFRLAGATIAETLEVGTDVRPYRLFLLDLPVRFDDADPDPYEHDDLAWWSTEGVDELANADELHPPFSNCWERLRR